MSKHAIEEGATRITSSWRTSLGEACFDGQPTDAVEFYEYTSGRIQQYSDDVKHATKVARKLKMQIDGIKAKITPEEHEALLESAEHVSELMLTSLRMDGAASD